MQKKITVKAQVYGLLSRIYAEKDTFLGYGKWTLDVTGNVIPDKFITLASVELGHALNRNSINRYRQRFEFERKLGVLHGDQNIKVA